MIDSALFEENFKSLALFGMTKHKNANADCYLKTKNEYYTTALYLIDF